MKIRRYGYQTLECFIATLPTGRLVHVGEIFNRFAYLGLSIAQKCGVWQPGSARTHWGSYSAPPDLLAVIRGAEGDGGERKGWKY